MCVPFCSVRTLGRCTACSSWILSHPMDSESARLPNGRVLLTVYNRALAFFPTVECCRLLPNSRVLLTATRYRVILFPTAECCRFCTTTLVVNVMNWTVLVLGDLEQDCVLKSFNVCTDSRRHELLKTDIF